MLLRIVSLFAVDSLAGGFLTTALLSYFFFERFGASEGAIALLFFGARILNALSHLAAAWLARRIGLVNTMVFTHLPSSLFLVPWRSTELPGGGGLFLAARGLVEMDVRRAVVRARRRRARRAHFRLRDHEPGADRGVGSGAVIAGGLMGGKALFWPLVVGAAMRSYDLCSGGRSAPCAPEERAA